MSNNVILMSNNVIVIVMSNNVNVCSDIGCQTMPWQKFRKPILVPESNAIIIINREN